MGYDAPRRCLWQSLHEHALLSLESSPGQTASHTEFCCPRTEELKLARHYTTAAPCAAGCTLKFPGISDF